MKKLLLFSLFLFFANYCYAVEKITDISTSIYKIDLIKPEDGIKLSGSAFCSKVEKTKDGWEVTLFTCAHILFHYEMEGGSPDMQSQFIVHKFYPVPQSFIADKLTKTKLDGDIASIKFYSRFKPADKPIQFANELPESGAPIMIYGCPKGEWPNIKFYNYLDKKEDGSLFLMPSSRAGTSGSPVLNEMGQCIGVVSRVNFNFTQCEQLLFKK